MSGELLQDALVALIVLAAAGFLVWKRVRSKRRATPFCENCPGCGSGPQAPADPGLVGIDDPARQAR